MVHLLTLEKSGVVKDDAFFTILKLHGVDLQEAEKNRLKKSFSRAGKINFNDALQSVQIDLDSAVLNEEKWTVQKQTGALAQQAQNSLMPGKAISHLSRMSLAEFDDRQNEMKQEIGADNYGNMGNAVPTIRNADQVSKAQSSVSRPVQQKNMESLADFRSQLGLMKKNRPEDKTSDALDGISVMTPNIDA